MPIDISTVWKLRNNGKIVVKPDRECPKCYEVGEIICDSPFTKRLSLVRKCQNPDCENYGERWSYAKPWDDYAISELKEYKKWKEETKGSNLEFALKEVNRALENKNKQK